MSAQYEDKVVVITGGGGGIGKAAARRFLEEGATVVLSGTRMAVLEAARQAELDPTGERDAAARPAGSPAREDGRGAGRVRRRALRRRRRPRQQHRHLPPGAVPRADRGAARGGARLHPAPDLLGRPGRRARRWSRRGGGAIVNVGSMWAVDAIATTPTSAYSAAQAGRHALAKNLAVELAADGHPRQHRRARLRGDAGLRALPLRRGGAGRARLGRRLPPARPPRRSPADVVEAILFLAGDARRLDHGHDAARRRRRARRPLPRGPARRRLNGRPIPPLRELFTQGRNGRATASGGRPGRAP